MKSKEQEEEKYNKLRKRMVEAQIKSRGITDEAVINAMLIVPRHMFVPMDLKDLAYTDNPLPIGSGQTISQPYIVALMTELLQLDKSNKILEVGTGSGYQSAILAEIVKEVYTIEIIDKLYRKAKSVLGELGYPNVIMRCGDGYRGWEEESPFDGIIVTAAPDHIPRELLNQLKINHRMVLPIGGFYQELTLIEKRKRGIKKENIVPVRFVPMMGKDKE